LGAGDTGRRVLVIFPGALGDLICFAPALRELVRRYGDYRVELMARSELARFAVGRLGVAAAHSLDRAEVGGLFVGAVPPATRQFFGAFAAVHSFFAAGDPGFRAALSAVAREAHFYPFRPPGEGHMAEAYLGLVGGGMDAEPGVVLLAEDRAAASAVVTRMGGREPGLLLLPGSGSRAKNWPVENFIALAEMFAARDPLAVLGPAEEDLGPRLRESRVAVVRGLELGTVAALAARVGVFVGNDSGVSHLAAAAGARGVVLFGPTDPARWRPRGAVRVMRREPLAALTPAEVAAAVGGGAEG